MKCEEFMSALDAYIDGELAADEVRAIREHADGCAACRGEMKRAEFLRDALANMDGGITVPLEAQAAWRSAVKRECAQKRKHAWFKSLTAVAAAAIVLVGSITLIGDRNVDTVNNAAMPEAVSMAAEQPKSAAISNVGQQTIVRAAPDQQDMSMMIASDGESAYATDAVNEETDYALWKKIQVQDLPAACAALEQLSSEYEGSVTRESGAENEVTYRIELPGINLEDFTMAVGSIGDVRDSEGSDGEFDPAIVYVQLFV